MELTDLRVRLDQMTERLVSRLKDRSRFPLNHPVYEPGAVPIQGRGDSSFLEFALEGLEAFHASLGRYAYPGEFPLVSTALPVSQVARTVGSSPGPPLQTTLKEDLFSFYLNLLPDLCAPGEDPDTYGETVYVDADLLELLHERINVGRAVAAVKLDADPGLLEAAGDPERLAARLTDPAREEALIASVRAAAERYQIDPALAARVFSWIMRQTVKVEVSYITLYVPSPSMGASTGGANAAGYWEGQRPGSLSC